MSTPPGLSAASVQEVFFQSGHQIEGQVDESGSGSGSLLQALREFCLHPLRIVIIMFSNGDFYSGSLSKGVFSGDGMYTFANGDVQSGKYVDGYLDGSGSYTWCDKTLYEGLFRAGEMDGCGTLLFPSGDRFSGIWKNGVIAQGSFCSAVRDCCFAGNYSQGLRSGFGSETFQDGASYEGDYLEGLLHGFGILSLADGTVYEGSFVKGELQGQGKLQHPSLGSFIGEFSQSSPHGSGLRTYSNGDTFTGTFAGGLPILGVFQRASDGADLHISQSDRSMLSHRFSADVPAQSREVRATKAFTRRVRSLIASPRRFIDRTFATPSAADGPSHEPLSIVAVPVTPIYTREGLGDLSFTVLSTPTWV